MDTPLLAEVIHELHDIQNLSMGHLTGLEESFGKGIAACEELVFVASDLLRNVDVFNKLAVVGVDDDALRIVIAS